MLCRTGRVAALVRAVSRRRKRKRPVIERGIPEVGTFDEQQLHGAVNVSNRAPAELATRIQWERSYVPDNKAFCVYLAEDKEAIREHERMSGVPATRIKPVSSIMDPTTGA